MGISTAIDAYKTATDFDPDDPLIWYNLSGAYYEAGLYEDCINACIKAIGMLEEKGSLVEEDGSDEEDGADEESGSDWKDMLTREDHIRLENLRFRLLATYLHTHQWELALGIIHATGRPHTAKLRTWFWTFIQESSVWEELPDEKDARRKAMMDLPRYRPAIANTSQPILHGRDIARTQYDDDSAVSSDDQFSVFFAEIGDARHLYATLIGIAARCQKNAESNKKTYHLVINDVKPHALARDLIILHLLFQLSEVVDSISAKTVPILSTIYFVFASTILPRYAYDQIQNSIVVLLDDILLEYRNSGDRLASCLLILPDELQAIINVLLSWRGPRYRHYTTEDVIALTAEDAVGCEDTVDILNRIPECILEYELYHSTALLYPPSSFLHAHESQLNEILTAHGNNVDSAIPGVRNHLKRHWEVNVTALDDEEPSANSFPTDPFTLAYTLYKETGIQRPSNPTRLYDHVAQFFSEVAKAIKILDGKFTIELSIGDFATVLEKQRYRLDGRPENSPRLYDRIHLGNLPDYVGGSLTSFLYAIPLCKSHRGSYITSHCLKNASLWADVDSFNKEYLLLKDQETVERVMQVQKVSGQFDRRDECDSYLWDYTHWQPTVTSQRALYSLASEDELATWLCAVFFKIVIPPLRSRPSPMVVESPLNLATFLRLLAYLHDVGYPKQWLGMALATILENNETENITLPDTKLQRLRDDEYTNSNVLLSAAPYTAELSTLTVLYQRLLPFAVITPNLTAPHNIYEYTVTFPSLVEIDTHSPVLSLVFTSAEHTKNAALHRDLKLPSCLTIDMSQVSVDEKQPLSDLFEEGIVVVTTFKWDRAELSATFWMRNLVIEGMIWKSEEHWHCRLWRTDDWSPASSFVAVSNDFVSRGRAWADALPSDSESSSSFDDNPESEDQEEVPLLDRL
ncbi:hypothetical protein AJ80_01246 [Polytolypa hystricis UAMH7299]|uniref:DUF4470 domain-containing protein n=1 Tax=Polytolypa hystricis (strain UAMH7299) TaxID=1447883 RepID=A0A2B7Z0V9_POLH7|nr:hypothetical protein AJ80_01246 [Polytolypa hystricis UAMH7299]